MGRSPWLSGIRRSSARGTAWTPASLGASLKGWWKSDEGVRARTAADFVPANSEQFTLTNDIALDADSDWSVAFWAFHDTTDTQGYFAFDAANQGRAFMVSAADFRVSNDANATVLTGINLGIGTAAWDLIVIQNAGATGVMTVYVNGTLKATSAGWTGTITLSRIGSVNDAGYFFDGRFQEWAVWSAYALTAGDRTALLNGGDGITFESWAGTAPTAWWKMHENSGVREDSVGSNDLVDVNTVTANDGKVDYAAADGDAVWKWIDQSASALLPVQVTQANKPLCETNILNGLPVVRGDGAGDTLKVATGAISDQPLWGWMVVDDNDAATRYYFDGGAASKVSLFHDGTDLNVNAGSDVGDAHTAGAFHLVTFSVNGASSEIWVDGTSLATGDAGAQDQDSGIALFADNAGANSLAGDIAELGIAAGSPSADDLAGLKAYIEARYGLTVA